MTKSTKTVATDLFVKGSTKHKLFLVLSKGKTQERAVLNTICDRAEKSRMLIAHVLNRLAVNGYKVSRAKGTVTVTRREAKKAA